MVRDVRRSSRKDHGESTDQTATPEWRGDGARGDGWNVLLRGESWLLSNAVVVPAISSRGPARDLHDVPQAIRPPSVAPA